MKKIILFAAALALCACAGSNFVPKPTAEITRFDIDSLGLMDISFVFDVAISNPYVVGINLESVKTDFYVEEKLAFSTQSGGGLQIPSKNNATTSFIVTLKYADVIGIVSDYAKREYLSTHVKMEIAVPMPEIPGLPPSLKFNYDMEKKIPTVKPRISVANFSVKMPTQTEITEAIKAAGKTVAQNVVSSALTSLLSGKAPAVPTAADVKLTDLDLPLAVNFDIELANDTAARLDFTQLDYDFAVNGNPLVKGIADDITRKGNASVVSVASRFSTRNLTSGIMDAFQAGVGNFSLTGGTAIQFPEEIRKTPVPLKFTENGKFELR